MDRPGSANGSAPEAQAMPKLESGLQVEVLGAGCDVGRSCLLLTICTRKILLDCGAHPGYADKRRFPDFSKLKPNVLSTLDAILITHFHFDHAAALPLLTEHLGCTAPVYMTEPTRELAGLMLHDVVATSAARAQYCPFDSADVDRCLSNVSLIPLSEDVNVGRHADISVKAFYAGHVIGAVMLHVSHADKSVLYSGDFVTKADRHLRSAAVPVGLKPDLFITEATYCSSVRKEGRSQGEDELISAISETVTRGGKVLVPISAFGRVHAICSILDAHRDARVSKVPKYVVSGLASRANETYEKFRDWMVNPVCHLCAPRRGKKRSRFADVCTHRTMDSLRPFNRNEHWDIVHRRGPVVLFATPGNLSTGLSLDVLRVWGQDPGNLVVVPGFSFANTVAGRLVEGGEGVRCRLVNMSFGSHVDGRGLVRACRMVAARRVVLVHGERNKVKKFRGQLADALGVECLAPENGETIVVPVDDEGPHKSEGGENVVPDVSSEWEAVLDAYAELVQDKRAVVGR